MIANVDAYKLVRVCKHGVADDTPDGWESHTLKTLKGLEATEQSQLALHLAELTVEENKELEAFKLRRRFCYMLKTLIILLDTEKHWRNDVGSTIMSLNKNGKNMISLHSLRRCSSGACYTTMLL